MINHVSIICYEIYIDYINNKSLPNNTISHNNNNFDIDDNNNFDIHDNNNFDIFYLDWINYLQQKSQLKSKE
jgi:hypothetical protein